MKRSLELLAPARDASVGRMPEPMPSTSVHLLSAHVLLPQIVWPILPLSLSLPTATGPRCM